MPTSGSFLVDTNILVYAYDFSNTLKQKRAVGILDWLEWDHVGCLSTQILGEFFNIATRKLRKPLTTEVAIEAVEGFLLSWRTLVVTRPIVLEAGLGCGRHQLSFWDAQIWATAKLNQIPTVLSEDFTHGQRIEGVAFLNPFISKIPGEE